MATATRRSPVGTRVKYNASSMSDLHNGDLGTVVGADSHYLAILMDDPRGRRTRNLCGVSAHWTSSGSDFDVVEGNEAFTVGDSVRIVADGHSDCHGLDIGQEGVVTDLYGSDYDPDRSERLRVKVNRHGYDETYYVLPTDIERFDPSVPETLESFKARFLNLAVARGQENGATHSEQVTTILDEFARAEFLSPSPDLDSFKKRVVEFAYEGKKRYAWCPEPERFLTDLGLTDLMPVKKEITVVMTVTVTGEQNTTRDEWRALARTEASRQAAQDEWNFSIPNRSYTVTNDL